MREQTLLTASSASFSECVDIPPVLFRLVRLCSLSAARKDSCSSLSRLERLTLETCGKSMIKTNDILQLVMEEPLMRRLRTFGQILDRRPRLSPVGVETVHNLLVGPNVARI